MLFGAIPLFFNFIFDSSLAYSIKQCYSVQVFYYKTFLKTKNIMNPKKRQKDVTHKFASKVAR